MPELNAPVVAQICGVPVSYQPARSEASSTMPASGRRVSTLAASSSSRWAVFQNLKQTLSTGLRSLASRLVALPDRVVGLLAPSRSEHVRSGVRAALLATDNQITKLVAALKPGVDGTVDVARVNQAIKAIQQAAAPAVRYGGDDALMEILQARVPSVLDSMPTGELRKLLSQASVGTDQNAEQILTIVRNALSDKLTGLLIKPLLDSGQADGAKKWLDACNAADAQLGPDRPGGPDAQRELVLIAMATHVAAAGDAQMDVVKDGKHYQRPVGSVRAEAFAKLLSNLENKDLQGLLNICNKPRIRTDRDADPTPIVFGVIGSRAGELVKAIEQQVKVLGEPAAAEREFLSPSGLDRLQATLDRFKESAAIFGFQVGPLEQQRLLNQFDKAVAADAENPAVKSVRGALETLPVRQSVKNSR